MALKALVMGFVLIAGLCRTNALAHNSETGFAETVRFSTPVELARPLSREGATEQAPLRMASVDLCYVGQVYDPKSGKMIAIFEVCTHDAIAGNLDLA